MARREYDFKVIGNNLKKLRMKNNLTAENVREYMQLGTVQAVYKWERGDCLPQADSLLALMELYGVNRIDMITGVSEMLTPVPFLSDGAIRIRRTKKYPTATRKEIA